MKKFNNIKNTDKYQHFAAIMRKVEALQKREYNGLINDIKQKTIEIVGDKYLEAYNFNKRFNKIKNYCDHFFDCEEDGFSYELGCKYQHIDFDFPGNIDAEIRWLKELLKIYNSEFKEEIRLIKSLITDLQVFKFYFEDYYEHG